MPDEIDKEVTTTKVTSNSDPSVNGYKVSEQRSSTVTTDNSATGLIVGILFTLVLGGGAVMYFLNSRPTPTLVVPGSPTVIKDNKSTVIERTTIKEAPTQPAPKVEVNVPSQPAPKVEVNVPAQPTPKVEVNIPAPVNPLVPTTPPAVPPSPSNN